MKETEVGENKWKGIHCSWMKKLILLKCLYYSIYKQCNAYGNIHVISHRTRINNPKICKKLQNSLNYQNNLIKKKKKKEQRWRYQTP